MDLMRLYSVTAKQVNFIIPKNHLNHSGWMDNVFVLAGAGKTYTMFGPEGALDSLNDELKRYSINESSVYALGKEEEEFPVVFPQSTGLVVRCCDELLRGKRQLSKKGIAVSLYMKLVEIYNEQVRSFFELLYLL